MININYIYIDTTKPQIGRDIMEKYADSVGFTKVNIKDILSNKVEIHNSNCILDYGYPYWDLDFDVFKSMISECYFKLTKDNKVIFRIVDDNPPKYNEFDFWILNFIRDNNITLTTPYDIKYLGWLNPVFIPFHYIKEDEYEIGGDRDDLYLLSGLRNWIYYPYRTHIYDHAYQYDKIKVLQHPGYSGRLWSGCNHIGKGYLDELTRHKFMIVTDGDECEVVKYVECAECGCLPVGYFSPSLRKDLPWLEESKLHFTYPDDMISSIINNHDYYVNNYEELAKRYRDDIIKFRSKELIITKYENLFS